MTKFNVIDLAPELMLNMAYIQLPDTPVQKARHVKCMLIPYGKSERFKVAVESSVMEGDAKGPDFCQRFPTGSGSQIRPNVKGRV